MERSWIYRRVAVFFTLAFCAGMLIAITVFGADTMLSITLAQGFFLLFGSTLGAYVFGAEWADKNQAREIMDGIKDKMGPRP